jgi:hypothetical protein
LLGFWHLVSLELSQPVFTTLVLALLGFDLFHLTRVSRISLLSDIRISRDDRRTSIASPRARHTLPAQLPAATQHSRLIRGSMLTHQYHKTRLFANGKTATESSFVLNMSL